MTTTTTTTEDAGILSYIYTTRVTPITRTYDPTFVLENHF
jgi:hypothetical protein